ncbi:hypothetical protein EEB19_13520 [Gordonia sp. OPL2]|nr:hypothetical protein EEB19_13520 [Gordonia sp. OPL2]
MGGMMAAMTTVMIAAGCAGSDSGTTPEATKAVAETADAQVPATTVPAKDLVLGKADLPAGYQVMPIPPNQVQQSADNMLDTTKGATISPAECAPPKTVPDRMDVSQMGMLVAMKGSTTLSETVMPRHGDLSDMRDSMTGECSKVTASFSSGEVAGARSTIVNTPVELPDTNADDVFAVKQTSTSTVNGREVTATSLMAWAQVGGYSVAVTSGGLLGGPDTEVFSRTLVTAIDKVAAAH